MNALVEIRRLSVAAGATVIALGLAAGQTRTPMASPFGALSGVSDVQVSRATLAPMTAGAVAKIFDDPAEFGGGGTPGEEPDDIYGGRLVMDMTPHSVLCVNVHASSYDADGEHVYQTLLAAGADAVAVDATTVGSIR